MSYSLEILNSCIEKDKAVINLSELSKITKNTKIPFTCHCGKQATKTFVRMKISGMLCELCTKSSKKEKTKQTNLEKYGTEYTFQNKEVKEKGIKTIREKYGVDNVFQLKEIQDKIKVTNIQKYGVENPYASEEIKEKIRNTCKEKYGTEFPMKNKQISQKVKETNIIKYGVEVSSKADCVKEKAKETNLEKYGSTHHVVPVVLEKIKKTNFKKYGVEHSFQAESVKEKIKETVREKYGVEYSCQSSEVQKTITENNLKKYGVKHPSELKIFKDKKEKTCLERYGVKNPNQSPEIHERSQKNGLKFKTYITPTGQTRKVQGYEPFALDKLFKEYSFHEDDILTDRSKVPCIHYIYNEKNKVYFPDIYIKSQNKIIEVKSNWTIQLHKEVNYAKQDACVKGGYIFEFWIFNKKGELTVC